MVRRFSDYFHLNKSQAELDFVDIPLDTDLPLFIDPYAFGLENDPWYDVCNNLVVEFFEKVLDSIVRGDRHRARQLLAHLQEPNDTHLGLSRGRPRGSGVGADQAGQIYSRLAESRAVQTGLLQDLADAELLIPGIGSDKISDITTNIIRNQLIKYTQTQCELYEVPMQRIPSGMWWDEETGNWRNTYVQLPMYRNSRILLVPKAAVRYHLSLDHQTYYRDFVLEFLRSEHLDSRSSLVTVLRNGKRVVRIKDLKERYPLSKDFLFDFSEEHPEVMERYKESIPPQTTPLDNEKIEERQPEPRTTDVDRLISDLSSIHAGRSSASKYHNFILGALTFIFYPLELTRFGGHLKIGENPRRCPDGTHDPRLSARVQSRSRRTRPPRGAIRLAHRERSRCLRADLT